MMNVSPVSALITPLARRGHRKQSLPPPSSHSEARPWWEPEELPADQNVDWIKYGQKCP